MDRKAARVSLDLEVFKEIKDCSDPPDLLVFRDTVVLKDQLVSLVLPSRLLVHKVLRVMG
tara:strand:- start:522 stop:701 length:180 start_codon:yes stop_codon:yes gene_type:complete